MALVLAAGTVLVVAAPARAATTGLDGVITDASTGAPLAGANVLAIPRIGGSYGNATTDAAGHYAIPQLAPGRYAIEDFGYEEIDPEVYGDTAVVVSRYSQTATLDGRDVSARLHVTDVWIRRDGRWQIVRRHATVTA